MFDVIEGPVKGLLSGRAMKQFSCIMIDENGQKVRQFIRVPQSCRIDGKHFDSFCELYGLNKATTCDAVLSETFVMQDDRIGWKERVIEQ